MQGAGGTDGGRGLFLLGLVCAAAGGYLLLHQVTVTGGSWMLWGYNGFGLSLVPFILGVGLLFFDGKSVAGWILLVAGLAIVLAAVLMNLRIYFEPTSLFNTLMMFALLAGGVGMLARSLRATRMP